jgi:hypothetical protein
MKKLYEENDVKNIAESIRNKTNATDTITFEEMSEKVEGIDLETYQSILDGTITSIDLPNVTRIGKYAFNYCTNLKSINLPNVTSVGEYAFNRCTGLGKGYILDFPKLETICESAFNYCLTYCGHFVIRKTDGLVKLEGGYYQFGGYNVVKPSYFYFPKSLLSQYKTADVWKIYYDASSVYQFRALEDYTVDGTVTGELDKSKI